MAHTKAPWKLGIPYEMENGTFHTNVITDYNDGRSGKYIAQFVTSSEPKGEELKNLQMQASAPQLLECLEWAMEQLEELSGYMHDGNPNSVVREYKRMENIATEEIEKIRG